MFSRYATTIVAGTTLTGMQEVSYQRRPQKFTLGASGTLHNTFHSILREAPTLGIKTVDLAAVLALLNGSTDAPMKSGQVSALLAKTAAASPAYDPTASAHIQVTAALAETYLREVSWSDGGPAMVSLDVFSYSSDGTTDPVVESAANAPGVVTPVEAYTLTGCTLNAIALNPESVTLSINPKAENNARECYQMGLPFPVFVTKAPLAGPVEISCAIETAAVGAVIGAGALVLTFTNMAQGGRLGATTKTFTLNAGLPMVESLGATRRLTYHARANGATLPLTIA